MLCEKIYESALALLGESIEINDNLDYQERAPYLIASFCAEAQDVDKNWRDAQQLGVQGDWDTLFISLNDSFPLSDRFANAAALYLAAMLVVESNETLSDKLFDHFCNAMSTIDSNIESSSESEEDPPITKHILESIKNVYF